MAEWEYVDGYDNEGGYIDEDVFEINPKDKQVAVITDQPLVCGENNSQFIRFQMPRFYDGVDLATKSIQIIYMTESGWSDINAAVMVEKNEEYIRFGWLVPQAAVYEVGTLSFSIEFVGDNYTLKTIAADVEVKDGLNGGEIIEEPTEKVWYIELQSRCDYILSTAENARDEAKLSQETAEASKNEAQAAASAAKESEQTVKDSADSAAESATAAGKSAELAASVFKVAGDVSFAIAADGGVTMVFSDTE